MLLCAPFFCSATDRPGRGQRQLVHILKASPLGHCPEAVCVCVCVCAYHVMFQTELLASTNGFTLKHLTKSPASPFVKDARSCVEMPPLPLLLLHLSHASYSPNG